MTVYASKGVPELSADFISALRSYYRANKLEVGICGVKPWESILK